MTGFQFSLYKKHEKFLRCDNSYKLVHTHCHGTLTRIVWMLDRKYKLFTSHYPQNIDIEVYFLSTTAVFCIGNRQNDNFYF